MFITFLHWPFNNSSNFLCLHYIPNIIIQTSHVTEPYWVSSHACSRMLEAGKQSVSKTLHRAGGAPAWPQPRSPSGGARRQGLRLGISVSQPQERAGVPGAGVQASGGLCPPQLVPFPQGIQTLGRGLEWPVPGGQVSHLINAF